MYFDILDTTMWRVLFQSKLGIYCQDFQILKNRFVVSIIIKKIFAINVESIASKLQFYIFKHNKLINNDK